jgi:hypothetical protein
VTVAQRPPVRRQVLYWVVSLPVLAETAVGIQWDLARVPYVIDMLDRLGLPHYLTTVLGVSKVLALAAVLVPGFARLKEWAYAGVFFVYATAAACHAATGGGAADVGVPLAFAALTLVSWALRPPDRRDPVPLPRALRFGR